MKVCSKCGLSKPELDFNLNGYTPGGLRADCKKCVATRCREHRRQNMEKYRLSKKGFRKAYRIKHPEKARAHDIVANMLKARTLVREPCEVCGDPDVHGHHDDYSKPREVRWLCLEHHREHHRKEKRGMLKSGTGRR